MFSSIFSTSAPTDPNGANFYPVSSKFEPEQLFGELKPNDTEWLCAGGFATETQIWYTIAEDGSSIMCQVIHSSVGVWFPTIQFTFKFYNAQENLTIWRSVNVSNFLTPPNPALDKRSCKADEFSVTHHPQTDAKPEHYTVRANLSEDLQVSVEVVRPVGIPGFKIGSGPNGGYSYFGKEGEKPEGYVIHRFWPRTISEGTVIHRGKARMFKGPGMFVHAIQGMRPNLVATRWNFANFQSDAHGGVSAIQMEFTTLASHGRKGPGSGGVSVNVGGIVLGGKLVAVTAETKWPDEAQPDKPPVLSRATHLNTYSDSDTGYSAPSGVSFRWAAPALSGAGPIEASLQLELGGPGSPKGLIEKVDVLAELPYVVKKAVNYVAGTKPYIYQWINPTKLLVKGPESVLPGLSGGLEIEGRVYSEATFIS